MKPKQAAVFSFAVIAACIISYEVFDAPAARFCATVDYRIKDVFELITRLGLSMPYLVAALAGFIYFNSSKKTKSGQTRPLFCSQPLPSRDSQTI